MRGMGTRAVLAALPVIVTDQLKHEAYRVYVTDSLMHLVNNTQRFAGGVAINSRYADIIERNFSGKPKDERTGEEIVADIVKKAGLEVKGIEPI